MRDFLFDRRAALAGLKAESGIPGRPGRARCGGTPGRDEQRDHSWHTRTGIQLHCC